MCHDFYSDRRCRTGLGAAVARKFGAEGFAVGLISRNRGRVDVLADQLPKDGVAAKGFAEDVRTRAR